MDPGVRVAYTVPDARDLGRADRVGLQNSSWADVDASPPVDWGRLRSEQHPRVQSAAPPVVRRIVLRPQFVLDMASTTSLLAVQLAA